MSQVIHHNVDVHTGEHGEVKLKLHPPKALGRCQHKFAGRTAAADKIEQGEACSSLGRSDRTCITAVCTGIRRQIDFYIKSLSTLRSRKANIQSTIMSGALRSPTFLVGLANLFAIGGATYHLRSHHVYNLEEHEARMDELEGTLRGHIGLIEEALDRLEGKGGERGKKT